jgi:hypothetical protein
MTDRCGYTGCVIPAFLWRVAQGFHRYQAPTISRLNKPSNWVRRNAKKFFTIRRIEKSCESFGTLLEFNRVAVPEIILNEPPRLLTVPGLNMALVQIRGAGQAVRHSSKLYNR